MTGWDPLKARWELLKEGDDGRVGLRALLEELDLPKDSAVLDLGAGGFGGTSTTTHLVDLFSTTIDAVEKNPTFAESLKLRFGDRVNVIVDDVHNWTPDHPYDLMVSDLGSDLIPSQVTDQLFKLKNYLNKGGHYISVFIYDCDRVFSGSGPLLNPLTRSIHENFLQNNFGTTKVVAQDLQDLYSRNGLRCLKIVDKQRVYTYNGIGWLLLQNVE